MKRGFIALAWAVLFAGSGAVFFVGAALVLLPHAPPPKLLLFLSALGAAEGLIPWSVCLCFTALPGVFPPKPPADALTLRATIAMLLAAALLMGVASTLPALLPLNHGLIRGLHTGRLRLPDFNVPLALESSALAGELGVALWLSWLLRHLSPALLHSGTPTGIAWSKASRHAYGMAFILALVLVLSVVVLLHLIPPDMEKVQNLNAAKLFSGPEWALPAIGGAVAILAPIVEEILFRGIAFAGVAAKWGTSWAVVLTSLLFAAAHAPEKIYYWPGFAGVGVLALAGCWLRLRYRSIRPGILLHMVYNGGLLLAAPLLH